VVDFLTLLVGLVIGVHDVELAVSGPVARVEIRLDGEVLAAADGEPWVMPCDFGREPRPGELEAVAFDIDGRELARARRWINLPDERADAEIVAIRGPGGGVTGARLAWSSPEFDRPRKILVELDGAALKVRPPFVIDLEDIPAREVHVLTAELSFSAEVVVRRELVFGGEFGGDHDSGLTAVAVVLEDLDELPPAEAMEGWFLEHGQPLRVAAGENPAARLVIVRDPATVRRLSEMGPELERRRKKSRRNPGRDRGPDTFDDEVAIRVLSPEPFVPDGRALAALLFPISDRPTPGSKGLVTAAVGTSTASSLGGPLMMADAVAVAGVRAAEGNERRAVVLLLGGKREDGGRFPPEVARRYLADLHVPLVVWDLSGPAAEPPSGWGEMRPVDNVDDLARGVRRLRYQLDEQRIVWLNGRHLPQEIELSAEARGIRLAQ
jgi:hypothetical protein